MVTITGGPAWAIGCKAEYIAFDNSLIVYGRDGKPVWCDAKMFKYS